MTSVGLQGIDVKVILSDLAFNASGHVLHGLFWTNMSPKGDGKPGGNLADQLNKDFGSFDSFKLQLGNAAKTVEGSGWGILAYAPLSEQLLTLQAEKHQNLTAQGSIPLLVLDVWEHDYYLQSTLAECCSISGTVLLTLRGTELMQLSCLIC